MGLTIQKMSEVVQDVLEITAFAFVSPEPPEDFEAVPLKHAVVAFRGQITGSVCLTMPVATLAALTANMLALEDGQSCSSEQQSDALGELTNMMCGNLLRAVAGPRAVFDIEPPRVAEGRSVLNPQDVLSANVPLENGWAELSVLCSECRAGVGNELRDRGRNGPGKGHQVSRGAT